MISRKVEFAVCYKTPPPTQRNHLINFVMRIIYPDTIIWQFPKVTFLTLTSALLFATKFVILNTRYKNTLIIIITFKIIFIDKRQGDISEKCIYSENVLDVDCQTQGRLKFMTELCFSEKSVIINSKYLISVPSYFCW
jgi:hypothetical protein